MSYGQELAAKHALDVRGALALPRLRYKGAAVPPQRVRRLGAGIEEVPEVPGGGGGTAVAPPLLAARGAALDVRMVARGDGDALTGVTRALQEAAAADGGGGGGEGGGAAIVASATPSLRERAQDEAAAALAACTRRPVVAAMYAARPPASAAVLQALVRAAAARPQAPLSVAELRTWLAALPAVVVLPEPAADDSSVIGAAALVLVVHFLPLELLAAAPRPTPAAILGKVSALLSVDGRGVEVAAPGYARLHARLPWPCAGGIDARATFAESERTLTVCVRRQLAGGAKPAAPSAAAVAAACDDSACLAALLSELIEAGAAPAAPPEPGSRPWLLARSLASDGETTRPSPATAATAAAAAAARPTPARAVVDDELPEDRFHRADALSAHFLQMRKDDADARAGKVREARAADAAAALEAARREVAATSKAAASASAAVTAPATEAVASPALDNTCTQLELL